MVVAELFWYIYAGMGKLKPCKNYNCKDEKNAIQNF